MSCDDKEASSSSQPPVSFLEAARRRSSTATTIRSSAYRRYAGKYFIDNVEPQIPFMTAQDSVEQASEVVSYQKSYKRYMLVVSHGCTKAGIEQHSLVGIHYNVDSEEIIMGVMLPVFSDMKVNLRGDGDIEVSGGNQHETSSYWFKPCTINGFWQIVGKLFQLIETATDNDYENQTWLSRFQSHLTQDGNLLNEWTAVGDLNLADQKKMPDTDHQDPLLQQIKLVLTKVMSKYNFDQLEDVSSKELRELCEKEIGQSLRHLREYIDGLILGYMGRGEKASQIFDFLYLGSEWNASDGDFMKQCNVKQIINCAGEIENFFSGTISYHNLRVEDVPSTDLMRYFDDTYQFLKEAKTSGHSAFVHCKMGVSRSASVVIAFAMKEYQWSFQNALQFVRQRRPIIQPNKGFMAQLQEYEGILAARNNKVWGALAASSNRPSMSWSPY